MYMDMVHIMVREPRDMHGDVILMEAVQYSQTQSQCKSLGENQVSSAWAENIALTRHGWKNLILQYNAHIMFTIHKQTVVLFWMVCQLTWKLYWYNYMTSFPNKENYNVMYDMCVYC